MKDKNTYIIDTTKLDTVIQEFVDNNNGITINRTDTTNEIKLDIVEGSRKGILHLYYKEGGNFSHYEQGEWVQMAIACWTHIYTSIGMLVTNKVLPAIRKVKKVDFEAFIDCFRLSDAYSVSDKEINNDNIEYAHEIGDSNGAKISIAYYKNKSMHIQGAPNALLVKILTDAIDSIPQADSSLIDYIVPSDRQVKSVIDADIKKHIENTTPIIGGKIEKLINTSLTLINSGIIVEDYSPFSSNVLRALDAVMNGIIKQAAAPVASYHDYFVGDPSCGYRLKVENNPFAADAELTALLEEAYTYYHNHRHPIAHTDHQNVETTRILTYDEAALEIRDTLALINRICSKW